MDATVSLTSTQKKIADAALELFAHNGYKGTTTRDIAKLANVNESTLFKNFGSKQDIFLAGKNHEMSGFEKELNEIFVFPYQNLSVLVEESGCRLFALFLSYRNLMILFFREMENPDLQIGKNTFFELAVNQMQKAMAEFLKSEEKQVGMIVFQFVSSLLFLALNESTGGILTDDLEISVTVQELCDITIRMLQK